MDFCNYMPYRHHQPYYGSQYFHETFPAYHGDFYGQHMYHDYYGTTPYYNPQHWQGFMQPDYVYNPKEARMRKAMREASRERSLGGSPMLPRPSARRATGPPHGWMSAQHEEPMMMSTLGPGPAGLRCPSVPGAAAGLDSSPTTCFVGAGTERFVPMTAAGAGPYSAAAVSKMDSPLPQPPPPARTPALPQASPSFLQPNPLAQLQHQTEMWPGFHDDMRPRSSGNPYMLQEVTPPHHYHHQPSPPLSIPSPLLMDKHRHTPIRCFRSTPPPLPITPTHSNPNMPVTPPHSNLNIPMTPPHSNENVPPGEALQQTECFESKQQLLESVMQPLMENNSVQQQLQQQESEEFVPVCPSEMLGTHRQYEKAQEGIKLRKIPTCSSSQSCFKTYSQKSTVYLPSACTNFFAPPDICCNNLDYQREYISRYFQNIPDYEVLNFAMTEDGDTFPYATLSSVENDSLLQESPQPNFIRTDVGYIPITFDTCKNNPHLNKIRCNLYSKDKS